MGNFLFNETKDDYVYKDDGLFGTGNFIGVVYEKNDKIRKQFKESDSAHEWINYIRSLINKGQLDLVIKMRYTSRMRSFKKGDYVKYIHKKKKSSVYIAKIDMQTFKITKRFRNKKSANEWISCIRQFIDTEGEDMILKLIGTY